jgi:hypothetical protein
MFGYEDALDRIFSSREQDRKIYESTIQLLNAIHKYINKHVKFLNLYKL